MSEIGIPNFDFSVFSCHSFVRVYPTNKKSNLRVITQELFCDLILWRYANKTNIWTNDYNANENKSNVGMPISHKL